MESEPPEDDPGPVQDNRLPGAQAEFDALHDAMEGLLKKRFHQDDDQGEDVRVTLTVPKEWMILAAWMEIKLQKRWAGDLSTKPFPIDIDPNLAHWRRAKTYIGRLLNDHFHHELHWLAIGRHPLLYAPKPAPPAPASKPGRTLAESMDDDIPF